ncbi:MAG: ATP-binding cassette domain-containing protein [Verrucomicrobiota bacterium]
MENLKNELETPLIEMIDASIAPAQLHRVTELKEINWCVKPGNFWAIGGLHGSGKTDFMATAAGLQQPAAGVLKIFSQEISDLHEDELLKIRLRIGLVFAVGGRLFNRLTVAENVALPLRYHRNWKEEEAEESVREILELTDLIPYARQIPSALSRSWQQRAALARALVLKPEILLLDSPLLGLDLRQQKWWLDFLKNLSEGSAFYDGRPVTIVVTTDNFQPWKELARQFAILKNNRWHELGGRAELDASDESLQELWAEEI